MSPKHINQVSTRVKFTPETEIHLWLIGCFDWLDLVNWGCIWDIGIDHVHCYMLPYKLCILLSAYWASNRSKNVHYFISFHFWQAWISRDLTKYFLLLQQNHKWSGFFLFWFSFELGNLTLYYNTDYEVSSMRAVPAVLLIVFHSHLVVPKFTEGWKSLFTYTAVMANILRKNFLVCWSYKI